MKLRDRVVAGFGLSLVLVTVLFVVDQQNESARELQQQVYAADSGGVGMHGRSNRSRVGNEAARNAAANRLAVSSPIAAERPRLSRPSAPQPQPARPVHDLTPDDPFAADPFEDLIISVLADSPRRGNVSDWTAVNEVIVDDTYYDGTISNEYFVEYFEEGSK